MIHLQLNNALFILFDTKLNQVSLILQLFPFLYLSWLCYPINPFSKPLVLKGLRVGEGVLADGGWVWDWCCCLPPAVNRGEVGRTLDRSSDHRSDLSIF